MTVYKVYMYSLNYNTGKIKERIGYLYPNSRCPCGGFRFNEKGSRLYMTSPSNTEGVVRGNTVWFHKSNYDEARKKFLEKAESMKKLYLEKSKKTERTIYEDNQTELRDSD